MQKPLTQILKETFGVSEEDLKEAQKIKTEKGDPLGEILVAKKTITETQRLEALSIQYDIPFWPDLPLDSFKTDFISQVPIQFLKKYVMVPLISDTEASDVNHSLPQLEPENATKTLPDSVAVIALNDPACIQPLDDLIRILEPYDFKLVLSTKDAILFAINISYDLSRDS
ncbi:MAG: type II secretion system protein GspE, partial [Deltaproteobacteria bacterium]|nr:type II secretion system protein GspE [Deltaproteobacteria bacterium]